MHGWPRVAPPGTLRPRCVQPRTLSDGIQPARHHGPWWGPCCGWKRTENRAASLRLPGCCGRGAPEVPGGGPWSRKVALPQREAWGQPGAGVGGGGGWTWGSPQAGKAKGGKCLEEEEDGTSTQTARGRDLRQPPEAGTLRSSKAGAAEHWREGFQTEPGPGVGGASASGRGWGPALAFLP